MNFKFLKTSCEGRNQRNEVPASSGRAKLPLCLDLRRRSNAALPSTSAFTMIEIAISLAVIGFAIVAIIGVLPYGLEVQGKNREETLINQDGPYLLEAIRNGAAGLDGLTNFVDSITILTESPGGTQKIIYTNSPGAVPANFNGNMISGAWIVGLLSRPKYEYDPDLDITFTNTVTAHIRSLSGALVEQSGPAKGLAFSYLLTSEIVAMPSSVVDANSTNYMNPVGTPEEKQARTNRWIEVTSFKNNLYDVRLKFAWPLLPNENTGSGRQVYRALVSGALTNYYTVTTNPVNPTVYTTNESIFFYFGPQSYLQAKVP